MSISPLNELVRRIVITGSIREDSSAQFLEQMTALEYIDATKLITIYIDTYGGNIDAAMLIYDAMRICKCPIRTIGIGKVMSAGSLILASGDPGNRFLTKNARVMIHQVSSGTAGPLADMENEIQEVKRLQDQYATLLAEHTNKSRDRVIKDLKVDNYMTAYEAVKYGLADKVLPYNDKTKSNNIEKRKAKNEGHNK